MEAQTFVGHGFRESRMIDPVLGQIQKHQHSLVASPDPSIHHSLVERVVGRLLNTMTVYRGCCITTGSCLIAFLLLASTTSALQGHEPSRRGLLNRRQVGLATAGLVLAPLGVGGVVAPPVASAAVDLSQYQDGPRGLKYLVTTPGSGTVQPVRGQKVRTSYTLFLKGFAEDGGQQVDSSKGFLGDKPFEFNVGVGQVIKGWDLSLLDMVEGEARRLIIPSSLAYGDKGAGGSIPGGSTLFFEVQLTELGKTPVLDDNQKQWMADNPL
jgi:hypothetical protein